MHASTLARLGVLALLAFPLASRAEEAPNPAFGEIIFGFSCAICHGETARGDGPMQRALKIAVPDLTRISARNGGSFPAQKVRLTIYGGAGAPAHIGQMPAWGDVFERGLDDAGESDPNAKQSLIERRIEDLVAYLQTLQDQ
jgi:mono/diheme cytochrome c family protein